jgi:hypothetical protein
MSRWYDHVASFAGAGVESVRAVFSEFGGSLGAKPNPPRFSTYRTVFAVHRPTGQRPRRYGATASRPDGRTAMTVMSSRQRYDQGCGCRRRICLPEKTLFRCCTRLDGAERVSMVHAIRVSESRPGVWRTARIAWTRRRPSSIAGRFAGTEARDRAGLRPDGVSTPSDSLSAWSRNRASAGGQAALRGPPIRRGHSPSHRPR